MIVRIKKRRRGFPSRLHTSVFFIDGLNDEWNLWSFTLMPGYAELWRFYFMIILFYCKSQFCFLRIILYRWLQDLIFLLRVSHGGKFVHIRVAQLQRLWFFFSEVWVLADLNSRNRPDAFLLIHLFSVYKINSDLKKKNGGWKEWSREFHFHSTFFLPIVYRRHQTALAGAGGYSISPIVMSLKKLSLIPDFCLLLAFFFRSCRNTERELKVLLCLLLTAPFGAVQFCSVPVTVYAVTFLFSSSLSHPNWI